MGEIIRETADLTADTNGFGCAKLVVFANAEFFDDLGSPGGAAKMGPTGKDVPFIAALPPQGE
ncbi:MAG: DUF711 family protein, partial [Rothia aeria]